MRIITLKESGWETMRRWWWFEGKNQSESGWQCKGAFEVSRSLMESHLRTLTRLWSQSMRRGLNMLIYPLKHFHNHCPACGCLYSHHPQASLCYECYASETVADCITVVFCRCGKSQNHMNKRGFVTLQSFCDTNVSYHSSWSVPPS